MKQYILTLFMLQLMTVGIAQNYKYLGSYTSDGTPEYFDTKDLVSQETLNLISNALPEGYPVPNFNPHYITSGYDTDVILEDNADVWVTFIGEGAGYRNVLGYYTYNVNQPLTQAPKPEDITIIFPNVSAKNSGGSLEVGHKVKIGRFSEGTAIGWVLLANGWNGSRVTPGLWQLYSGTAFNPEVDEDLRYHNVLLNDPDNERIILGFEDIRRDYSSCDNDFNDALFYITANPYTAIKTGNYNKITDYTQVSSGNNGGLESNGDLARLIAKRNFDRKKTNTTKDTQKQQQKYSKKSYKSYASKSGNLDTYFPESGMFGNETTYVSSPDDLLAITNANRIFSIDYYEGENRVSAALATETSDGVYNHTKTICDRLNNSELLDVRTIKLQGHQLVYTQLQAANGELEYALTFSVRNEGEAYTIYSLWNIDQYPTGTYRNFQLWGNSMGQVSTIANHIIQQLKNEKEVTSHATVDILPTVYIKKGQYRNGKLHLTVKNTSQATSLQLEANYKTTEQETFNNLKRTIALTGAWEEELVINTGYLFDAGISITSNNSPQYDALYLADGPWGADYNTTVDQLENFTITPQVENTAMVNAHTVERGVLVAGEVKETINIFRTLVAGDRQLPVANFNYLQFSVQNTQPIEISLVTDATNQWENRLRYTLPAHAEKETVNLHFSEFTDAKGNPVVFSELKTLVFSIQGDYETYKTFSLSIDAVSLHANEISNELLNELPNEEGIIEEVTPSKLVNYPNPFKEHTTLSLPNATNKIIIYIHALNGTQAYTKVVTTVNKQHSVQLHVPELTPGFYVYTVTDTESGQVYTGRMLKN